MREASEERGAWINCDIPYPLTFILLTAMVNDMKDLLRLEKRINILEESLRSLGKSPPLWIREELERKSEGMLGDQYRKVYPLHSESDDRQKRLQKKVVG